MDEANFDNNLSGFILSVLYAACSEMEADSLSDQRTRTGDTDTITIEPNKEREETVREEERVAVLGDFRNKELNRLTGTANQNRKGDETGDQNHGETDTLETEETASKEERSAFFQARSKSATTDFSCKQIDPGELKLDLTLLDEKQRGRTSHSELYTSSDIGDPSKPKLKPSFTQEIEERHETTRAQLSGSTNHKSTDSMIGQSASTRFNKKKIF
ncbi:unnamed protein product [Mytilus edulis]|uniref:Uncharacterized protein n=1 Tax=Mytilus edulis TaxID=6550 RepID=A0A8S3TN02_MYTED|nr:unnamed protein product [Mytilus edulis]